MDKCRICTRCGGCDYQGIDYSEQLKIKQKKIEFLLGKYGKINPIIGMDEPYYYRNKVHHVIAKNNRGVIVSGFYEEYSHRVVECDECQIENKQGQKIINTVVSLAESFKFSIYNEKTGRGFLRHVLVRAGYRSGEYLVILVATDAILHSKNEFVKTMLERHPEITSIVLNINNKQTTMVLGERNVVLYGPGYITDSVCNTKFRISPNSFYQINPKQTEKLYRTAIEYANLRKNEVAIDTYCGTGTIALIAAQKAGRIIGVELNKAAVKDAILNAKENKIENTKFIAEDATRFMNEVSSTGEKVDVVFMDPTRTGSTKEFVIATVKMRPSRIVYVSCNPETQSRDLEWFLKYGYTVKRIQPIDMFPMTNHVETVVLMTRTK